VDLEEEAVELASGAGRSLLLDRVPRGEDLNGSGRRCVVVPTVTRLSCIACKRAAWVLGGVRLISSARTRLWKIACEEAHPAARPPCPSSSSLEHVGSGDVGGEKIRGDWTRPKVERERFSERSDEERLREPRYPTRRA